MPLRKTLPPLCTYRIRVPRPVFVKSLFRFVRPRHKKTHRYCKILLFFKGWLPLELVSSFTISHNNLPHILMLGLCIEESMYLSHLVQFANVFMVLKYEFEDLHIYVYTHCIINNSVQPPFPPIILFCEVPLNQHNIVIIC